MGMSFEGQTKDADCMIWADVEVKNLATDVSCDLTTDTL